MEKAEEGGGESLLPLSLLPRNFCDSFMRNFLQRGRSGIAATASKEEVQKRQRHRRPISRRSTTLMRAGNVQHFAQLTTYVSAGNGRNIRDVVGRLRLALCMPPSRLRSIEEDQEEVSRIQSMSIEWDHIRRRGRICTFSMT